jgi:hypothetical protein
MPTLVAGIHVLLVAGKDVDGTERRACPTSALFDGRKSGKPKPGLTMERPEGFAHAPE